MKYAIIDTESSGLFDFSKPADAEGQPRLASLAMILLDDDLVEAGTNYFFVKPDGWELTEEVSKINGFTNEFLNENGLPIADVVERYAMIIDSGYVLVAFNCQYDAKLMRGEMRRAGIPDRFETTPNICVMRASTDIVKAPKKSGKGYKFPKLSEACAHFGIEQAEAHSAMGDARAACEIFRKLKYLSELSHNPALDASVHYAKVAPKSGEQDSSAQMEKTP